MAGRLPLTEQERADLVAYLDGELHGEAARAVEARIHLYPEVRAEAESLKRAWDLLDFLPSPEPSPSFTERTLSRAVPLPATEPLARPRRWPLVTAWAASVVLAFAAGWSGYAWLVPWRPGERELVQDLRVIENYRLYEPAGDLDFLRRLAQGDLFGEDPNGP
jgi:anti-sigma factor RsiW